MAKSVQQMSLSEIEVAPITDPVATVAELARRLRSRVQRVETCRQARIDLLIAAQVQSGSNASASDMLERAEAIEAARAAYVTVRLTGPIEE